MPTFKYHCNNCDKQFVELTEKNATMDCPICGLSTNQLIPSGGSTQVMEMRDRRRGKQVKKGVEKQLKKRMNEHHDRYEIAEKIDKHGLDTAKKFGWTKRDKKV